VKYFEKRFKLFGLLPVIVRRRVRKDRGVCLDTAIPGTVFNALHLGRFSLYWARVNPTRPVGKGWDVQAVHTNQGNRT
jgi:hypothetical protein